MARKSITGLYERNGIWHIDKCVKGERIQESTGESSREKAEEYLIQLLDQRRQQKVYGVRPSHTFREAATKYISEALEAGQASIHLSVTYLEQADPFIGDLPVSHVDDESLRPFLKYMREGGKLPSGKPKKPSSNRTINIALQRIIRVLHCCHKNYRDDVGDRKMPWLDAVPAITTTDEKKGKRPEYPLMWEEQQILFKELPSHLHKMALFKVNTGTREQEVCKLEWGWEMFVPELNTSVFVVPSDFGGRSKRSGVKNREDRVIILNDVASRIVDGQRGQHKKWVFPFEGRALHRMDTTAWKSARNRAAEKWQERYNAPASRWFRIVRVHDLKHTFGRRLKAAGVDFEDRQVLLGHKSGSVTTHYSGSELKPLIDAANKVLQQTANTPTLTMLKLRTAA